jgi:hypothetical protein
MAQSAWSAVLARVKQQMATITDIGKVNDRLQILDRDTSIDDSVKVKIDGVDRVRCWYLTLGNIDTKALEAGGTTQWTRAVVIEGFLDFEEGLGSEAATIALAERVIRTLWADCQTTRLGGTILFGQTPKLTDTKPAYFASLVCSHARIEFPVHTVESLT